MTMTSSSSSSCSTRERAGAKAVRRFGGLLLLVGLVVGSIAPLPACGGPRQWMVAFSTNADVPRMGDRLHLQVVDEQGTPLCDDCERDFAWQTTTVFPVQTFAITPTDKKVRVHARLYRGGLAQNQTAAIDVVARLPELESDTEFMWLDFPLPLECFGVAPNLEQRTTCRYDAADGRAIGDEPELSATTSTRLLFPEPIGCSKATPPQMACVGSGTFLLGDPRYEALVFDHPSQPESVQRIKPGAALMMDIDEMTVGEVRKLIKGGRIAPSTTGDRNNASTLLLKGAENTFDAACTYLGPDDANNDEMPVTCIGRDLARSVCKALGRRLPKEYEWEFAATNGVDETAYPWGDGSLIFNDDRPVNLDTPSTVCLWAVVGRGRNGSQGGSGTEVTDCLPPKSKSWGPFIGSLNLTDESRAGIRNLAGNVAEWVDDEFALYGEECWASLGGECLIPSKIITTAQAPYRGGSWASHPQAAIAVARFSMPFGAPSPYIGLRCAMTEDELP